MTKEEILAVIEEDTKENLGETLAVTKSHLTYFDYGTDTEITFRFRQAISDDYMKKLIYVGNDAYKAGITKEYIIDVLKCAFGDDYYDAVCTLSGIVIPSNENEYNTMLKKVCRTEDVMSEWYSYDDECNAVGRTYVTHQIAFINNKLIYKLAVEESDRLHSVKSEYEAGFLVTLIHEMRHVMLECNPFLPDDEFPQEMASEDAVEMFARNAYEHLGELKHFSNSIKTKK